MHYSGYMTHLTKWKDLPLVIIYECESFYNEAFVSFTCLTQHSKPKQGQDGYFIIQAGQRTDYMMLIHNKQVIFSYFQLVIAGNLVIWWPHSNTMIFKFFLLRKQVNYQSVSAPYMGVHIATGGCLGKPLLKKLEDHWTTGHRQAGLLSNNNIAPFVDVSACPTGNSLWHLSEEHPEEERYTGQHRTAASAREGDSSGQERRGSPSAGMTKVTDG